MLQRTLNHSFTLEGKGLHTGLELSITFNPAPDNYGYKIKRIDVQGEPVIDALVENVSGTQFVFVKEINELLKNNLVKGRIIAKRPGHKRNTLFAKEIRSHYLKVDKRSV